METYNGWSNRNTRLIAVHFHNINSKEDLDIIKEYLYKEKNDIDSMIIKDLIDIASIDFKELESLFLTNSNEK